MGLSEDEDAKISTLEETPDDRAAPTNRAKRTYGEKSPVKQSPNAPQTAEESAEDFVASATGQKFSFPLLFKKKKDKKSTAGKSSDTSASSAETAVTSSSPDASQETVATFSDTQNSTEETANKSSDVDTPGEVVHDSNTFAQVDINA